MADTDTKLPPVEDAGDGDVRLAPAPAKSPPEKTPAQESAEAVRDLMRQRVAALPEEEKRRAESERRQDEAAAKQAELNQRLREEQIRDLEENRQWRREHPRPVPPTISPPPQFHLTPPPGLFGESGTPQAQNAPGNQWMQALSVFGALGSGTDRRSAMTAMAAMTGMLKGWAQGQKEKFDESYKAWKDASQTIVQNYERQSRYYDDVLSDNKLSFSEKQQEIALRAGEFKDTITQELAVQGRLDQADKLFETRAKAVRDLASAEKSVVDLTNKQGGELTPDDEVLVDQIGTYAQPPVIPSARNPKAYAIMAEVHRRYPEFKVGGYKAYQDYAGGGRHGDLARSLENAVDHMAALDDLARAWNSGNARVLNRARAIWAQQTGAPEPTNLQEAANFVGAEVQKALAASTGREREAAAQNFSNINSGAQAIGATNTARRLLSTQLLNLGRQYKNLTGLNFNDLLDPRTVEVLLGSRESSSGAPGETSPPATKYPGIQSIEQVR